MAEDEHLVNVGFGEDWLEISYVDNVRQGKLAKEIITVQVHKQLWEPEYEQIIADIKEILRRAQDNQTEAMRSSK